METNSSNYTEYEEELDLRDLLIAVFRRWKVILLGMVVFAVILGVYKGVTGTPDASAQLTEEQQTTIANDQNTIASCQAVVDANQPTVDAYNEKITMYQEMLAEYEEELADADSDDRSDILSDIADLNSIIMSVQDRCASVQQTINDNNGAISTAQAEIDSINAEAAANTESTSKAVAKFAVIGAVLGAFLVCAWYALAYILAGTLRGRDELKNAYGMRVLGSLYDPRAKRKKGANGPVQRALDRMEGYPTPVNARKEFQLIAANICLAMGESKKPILITGTVNEKYVVRVQEEISRLLPSELYTIHTAPNPNSSAHSTLELSRHAIILVEAKDISRRQDIGRLMESVSASGAPLLGAIMV